MKMHQDRIELHNKAHEAIAYLKHNCKVLGVENIRKRDKKVQDLEKYIEYLEAKTKRPDSVG